MILCNKHLLVDFFSHLQFIIKSLAFCEFASINFETCVKLLLVQATWVWQVYLGYSSFVLYLLGNFQLIVGQTT